MRVLPAELRGSRLVSQGVEGPAGGRGGVHRRSAEVCARRVRCGLVQRRGSFLQRQSGGGETSFVFYRSVRRLPDEGRFARDAQPVPGGTAAERRADDGTHRCAVHRLHLRLAGRERAGRPRGSGGGRSVHRADQLLQSRRAEIREGQGVPQHGKRFWSLELGAQRAKTIRISGGTERGH